MTLHLYRTTTKRMATIIAKKGKVLEEGRKKVQEAGKGERMDLAVKAERVVLEQEAPA